jgi:hypothetical protein
MSFIRHAQNPKVGKPKVSGAIKPKGLNRITIIG